ARDVAIQQQVADDHDGRSAPVTPAQPPERRSAPATPAQPPDRSGHRVLLSTDPSATGTDAGSSATSSGVAAGRFASTCAHSRCTLTRCSSWTVCGSWLSIENDASLRWVSGLGAGPVIAQ